MSHPLFTDTITLYRKSRVNGSEVYMHYLVDGVQWRQRIVREAGADGHATMQTVTSVTIPDTELDRIEFPGPMQGDVLVLGKGPAITDAYTIADLRREHATYCTIRAIADNTLRPLLRHWRIEAQ